MTEDFDKIIENLEKGAFSDYVSDKKAVNFDDVQNYAVDLNSLEKVSYQEEKKQLNKEEDWHNLDVRLIDIINSFISTSERPVFLIRDDKLVYVNQTAMVVYGIEADKKFIGDSFFKLVVKEDWELLSKNIGEMITDSKEVTIRLKNAKGKITPASLRAIYLPESDHFSFILMCEHKKNKNKFLYSNLYDEATGLPNFFLFEDRVQVAIVNENAKENVKDVCMIAVIALNIDNIDVFRKMHIDDVIINKLADNLILNLPKTSTISVGLKYSFWLMLKVRSEEELRNGINRILDVLKDGVSDNFTKHEVSFSIGISCFPQKSRSSKKLMEQAIKALETNQKNSKSLYDFYTEEKV